MIESTSQGGGAQAPETNQEQWARCEVTGRRVRESQLVALHGRRMVAEAKQRLLERIPRTQVAADSSLERPTMGRRLACAAIDTGILAAVAMVAYMVGYCMYFGPELEKVDPNNMPTPPDEFQDGFQLLFMSVLIGYLVLFHGVWGRTPGKMWGRTRVVRIDGSEMSMETATVRALSQLIPMFLIAMANLIQDQNLVGELVLVALAFQIFDIGMALFDFEDQRSLHDRIAGTRVVQLPPRR